MEKILFLSVIALCAQIAVCGTLGSASSAVGASRIINGEVAVAQARYVVSLQKLSELHLYTRGHRCGGVLVTYQHAVTAASCNFDGANGVFTAINTAEYRVFSGAATLTGDSTPYSNRLITNITVHPEYFSSTPYVNDIAVIFLTQPFTEFTSTPVSLPTRDHGVSEFPPCNVAGWGAQDSTAAASVQLMQFNKLVSPRDNCQLSYIGQVNIAYTMMCASGVQQTQFAGCTGDIGNPLVCSGNLNGILILSKNCSVSAIPEVYTRISSYNPWIRSLTGIPAPSGASTFQPGMTVLALIAIAQIAIANVSN